MPVGRQKEADKRTFKAPTEGQSRNTTLEDTRYILCIGMIAARTEPSKHYNAFT